MLSLRTRLVLSHGVFVSLILIAVTTGVFALGKVDRILSSQEAHATMLEAIDPVMRVTTGIFAAIMIGGLALLLFTSRMVHQTVVQRLGDLIEVARARSRGDHLRRADPTAGGELGHIAAFINASLDELDELDAAAHGRLSELRRVLEGLLGSLGKPAAILTLDGRLCASNAPPEQTDALEVLAEPVRQASRQALADLSMNVFPLAMSGGEPTVQLSVLRDVDARAVGWIVTWR